MIFVSKKREKWKRSIGTRNSTTFCRDKYSFQASKLNIFFNRILPKIHWMHCSIFDECTSPLDREALECKELNLTWNWSWNALVTFHCGQLTYLIWTNFRKNVKLLFVWMCFCANQIHSCWTFIFYEKKKLECKLDQSEFGWGWMTIQNTRTPNNPTKILWNVFHHSNNFRNWNMRLRFKRVIRRQHE